MTKSRKVRRNILKKKVNRSARSGGNGEQLKAQEDIKTSHTDANTKQATDTQLTDINNPLLPAAASLTSGASDNISKVIQKISSYSGKCSNPISLGLFKAFQSTGVKPLLMMLEIPPSIDESIKQLLETGATLKDLLGDILSNIKCTDINTISEILRKILIIDEIEKQFIALDNDNQNLDENAKLAAKLAAMQKALYEPLNSIINDPKNQDLLCRMLNKMESNKHIKPEHKMAFIKLFGGSEEICKSMLSKLGESMSSGISSFFGSKSGDNANTEPDIRCGESQIVKKSWFFGDYCAPKSNEAPASVAEKEEETTPTTTEKEGETTPTTTEKEGETTPTTTEKEGETTPTTTTTEGKEGETTPTTTTTEGKEGKQKKGWFWGGKYKRVKKTKKSKKSKSKKSKRSKK